MNEVCSLLVVAGLLVLMFCKGAIAETAPKLEPTVWRDTLSNGLETVVIPRHHTATVAVDLYVRVGCSLETESTSGLTSLLARMLLRGTRRRTSDDIAREVAGTGGSISSTAHYLSSSIMAYGPAEAFELLLDIVADVALNPLLNESDMEKERRIVLHDLAAREDFPAYVFDKEIGERLFPGHPFGRPNDGTVESVSKLTAHDLREAHDRYFVPNNMLLVIVGNVQLDTARDHIAHRFGSLSKGALPQIARPPIPKLDGTVRATIWRRVAQAQLFIGVRSDGIDARGEYVLSVLDCILSHGVNSRLFTEIRENRGYVYDVHVEDTVYPDIMVWGVEAGTERKRLDEVEKLVRRELKKLAGELVSDYELEVVKRYMEASIRRSAEVNDGQAEYVGVTIIRGRPLLGIEERLQLVHSISKEDVKSLSTRLFGSGKLHVFTLK